MELKSSSNLACTCISVHFQPFDHMEIFSFLKISTRSSGRRCIGILVLMKLGAEDIPKIFSILKILSYFNMVEYIVPNVSVCQLQIVGIRICFEVLTLGLFLYLSPAPALKVSIWSVFSNDYSEGYTV